ncbi:aspartate/glutamate racemase family protein [Rossellomorea vietnamensis]|uniref:Aspartate/glutamate racemase family protein n=1 Tax=Rossellomorea vietnamensis TaxID=218284 RepID=A0A5D4NUQ2_9BACI|nr:aspartate/glutamate racemase family protein [Rossellomorea vietnamensis]TYS17660.1 aspartate/glutamate racemase family protein [Rossellomorea vietnamensis]
MKTIGLIGGMSWESSLEYYRHINETVKAQLGGLHSAKCILYSVDFEEIERYQAQGEWDKAAYILKEAAESLEKGGADFLLLCTNTMHKVFEDISGSVNIPFLHIADAAASKIRNEGVDTVGLLGTRYTMEQDFYRNRMLVNGVNVIVPGREDRERINAIIFEELCIGEIKDSSRDFFQKVMKELNRNGAEGIVLGCTEIGLLIKGDEWEIPIYDTAAIHAEAAVKKALQD